MSLHSTTASDRETMKQTSVRPSSMSMVLVAYALLLPGCDTDHLRVYPVKGKLQINGHSAAGVTVLFIAYPPINRLPCGPAGVTGADGSFSLTTFTAYDGAPPGDYRVILSWPEWRNGAHLGPDRLNNSFNKVGSSTISARVEARSNELAPFRIMAEFASVPGPEEGTHFPWINGKRNDRN
jgi:hypothetical protein